MPQNNTDLLIVTTHYPYGTIEENWVAHEVEEFRHKFRTVFVLPVKELKGKRPVPAGVQLLPPLASRKRAAFFIRHTLLPKTLLYFLRATVECVTHSTLSRRRLAICLKFACYRAAFERSSAVQSFLQFQTPKVVYAYWGHIPALIVPFARKQGAATCVRYHAGDLYTHRPEVGGFFPWRPLLKRTTDLSIFVSQDALQYFLSAVRGTHSGEAQVYRLGSGDYGPPRRRSFRPADGPIVMVSASWIDSNKRVDSIAQLAGELNKHAPTTWHHFGSGDTTLLDEAVASARKKGARIHLHGQVPVERLQSFYRETDVTFFVNLSRAEGIPISVVEALNADIPIVATAVGGTPEVVIERRSGMLLDSNLHGLIPALAERIIKELNTGGLLEIARPRQVWEQLCDGHRNARNLAKTLSRLSR